MSEPNRKYYLALNNVKQENSQWRIVDETEGLGPDHKKVFTCRMSVNGLGPWAGVASTKPGALDAASKKILEVIGYDLSKAAPY